MDRRRRRRRASGSRTSVAPTDPRLRACRAELLDDCDEHPPLRITLPDGSTLEGAEIEAALSELLERRVRLERSDTPADGRFGATGAYHDLAPIHLITSGHAGASARRGPRLGLGRPALSPQPRPRRRPRRRALRRGCAPGRPPAGLVRARALTVGLAHRRAASSPRERRMGCPPIPPSCARSSSATASTSGPSAGRAAPAPTPRSRAGRLRTGERLEVRRGHVAPRTVIDSAVIRLRDRP